MENEITDLNKEAENVLIEVTQSEIPCIAMEWSEYEKQCAKLQLIEQDVKMDHAYPKNILVQSLNCEELPKFSCNKCTREFSCLKDLRYHKRNVHNTSSINRYTKRRCSLCNISFKDENYVSHFEIQHNIKLDTEKLEFPSLDEFMVWKDDVERQTHSKFVKRFGSRIASKKTIHCFFCHRSGHFHSRSRGIRNLKTQGSHKINGFCPARIKVFEVKKDGKCEVQFLKTHIGHQSDIGHLPLTTAERQGLAEKIAAKIPFSRILDEIRDSMVDSRLERLHLVTKKDLVNIARSYNLYSGGKHCKDDGSSLEAWVNEVQVGENECILFYKDQGDVSEQCPELQATDFVLIMMNEAQCEILKKFGSDCICIDRTHGLNSCGLELVTLLIIDDLKQGFPCSFLISNRTDETVLTLFFSIIKERTGSLMPSVFMSDVANSFFNSWVQVMASAVTRLYCSWHVDQTWRKNLKRIQGKEKQVRVYKILRTLMEEPDPSAFEVVLIQTLNSLQEDPNTAEFGIYFSENFTQNCTLWAYCYRITNGLDINMHLENMHKTIKYIYLHGENVRSLDKAINRIMKFLKDKLVERLIILNKGKITKKLKNLRERHKASLLLEGTITASEEGWIISTAEENELVQENETNCRCKLMCTYCDSCIHQYSCTCIDACIKWNMCKHIHSICMYRSSVQNKFETTAMMENDNNSSNKDNLSENPEDKVDDVESEAILVELSKTALAKINSESLKLKKDELAAKFSELLYSLSSMNELEIVENSFVSLQATLVAMHTNIDINCSDHNGQQQCITNVNPQQ